MITEARKQAIREATRRWYHRNKEARKAYRDATKERRAAYWQEYKVKRYFADLEKEAENGP